jgi:cell division protein FtsB
LKDNNKWYYENIRNAYNYIIFKHLNNFYNNNKIKTVEFIEEYNKLINNFCAYNNNNHNKEDFDAIIKNIININDIQKLVLYSTTDTYFICFQIKTIYDNLNYFKNFIQEFRDDFDYSDEILNETIKELKDNNEFLNNSIKELKDNNEFLNNSIRELKKTNYIYSLSSIIFIFYNLFNYFF